MARVQDGVERSVSVATLRWHLVLLGISGIALSLASGWTTWDGMANFTHNPILSFLITFGIQSVMLISAWMIGETLADQAKTGGRGTRHDGGQASPAGIGSDGTTMSGHAQATPTLIWGLTFLASLSLLSPPAADYVTSGPLRIAFLVAAVAAGAMVLRKAFHFMGLADLVFPYERSVTAIFKNLPLWLMFLVCLAASVFFSFDSLFDKIYSSNDRERVSQSRLQGHVSGLLSDLHDELEDVRKRRISALFESPAWQSADRQLDAISAAVGAISARIEARRIDHARERSAQVGNEVAQLSAARAQLDNVDGQLARAKAELERIEQDLATAQSNQRDMDLALIEQRFRADRKAQDAAAEAAGNGVTKLVGKGQKYQQLKAEEADLRIAADQMAAKLAAMGRMVAKLEQERVSRAGRVETLQSDRSDIAGRIARSEWQIDHAPSDGQSDPNALAGLAPALAVLDAAKAEFLNQPTRQTFSTLSRQCAGISGMLESVGESAGEGSTFTCDTMAGSSALVGVFDANAALAGYDAACGKTRKLTGLSADEIFQTGQSCIQMSGLSSEVAAGFLSGLRQVAMRRDDRAHRFVVTWNAFFDTNPLAFVALFIALSIDGLVFITGLFGANAEVSLRMLPGRRPSGTSAPAGNSGEAILDFALLPDIAGSVRLLLGSLVPAPLERSGGLAGEIDLSGMAEEKARRIGTVLNAACALQLAEKRNGGDRYAIKKGLIDHLSARSGWQRGVTAGTWVENNPEEMIGVALGRQRRQVTNCILQHVQPVPAETGYAYALDVLDCPGPMQAQVASVMNASVAAGMVSGDPDGERRYLLTAAIISVLTRFAAGEPEPDPSAVDAPAPEAGLSSVPTGRAGVVADPDPKSEGGIPAAGSNDRVGAQKRADRSADDQPDKASIDGRMRSEGQSSGKTSAPASPPDEAGPAAPGRSSAGQTHGSDDPPREAAVSSKLITFPIESRSRPQATTGKLRSAVTVGSEDPPAASRSASDDSETEALERAAGELVAGSPIARQDVIDWFRSGAGPEFDNAWSCIQQLCRRDRAFDAKFRQRESVARPVIDRFGETLQAAKTDGGSATRGPDAQDKADAARRIYRPYLLRRYGVDQGMKWCAGALTELETNAVLETDPEARQAQLQLIEDVVARLAPLDADHRHEWSEIGLRACGLGRQHSELEAFSDLMP